MKKALERHWENTWKERRETKTMVACETSWKSDESFHFPHAIYSLQYSFCTTEGKKYRVLQMKMLNLKPKSMQTSHFETVLGVDVGYSSALLTCTSPVPLPMPFPVPAFPVPFRGLHAPASDFAM